MSAISSGLSEAVQTVSGNATSSGFNGLTADDFLTLLIAELQNQDPTEPVQNEQILNQLATMQSLQSSIELNDTLSKVAESLAQSGSDFGQRLSVGASYIGQAVTLDDSSVGIVDRAFVLDGQTFIGVNGADIAIDRVVSVNSPRSYVGSLVAVRGESAADATELGTVSSVVNRDGSEFLVLQQVDGNGELQSREVPADRVTNVLTAARLAGQEVQAVTSDGSSIQGTATATTTDNGQPALLIQGVTVTLDRVVGVGFNS